MYFANYFPYYHLIQIYNDSAKGHFNLHSQKFIYLPNLVALGLHCCALTFPCCVNGGVSSCCRLLMQWLLLFYEPQALSTQASGGVVHGLSCPTTCGVFPDKRSNPCSLHWRQILPLKSLISIFKSKPVKSRLTNNLVYSFNNFYY